jgi:eukaryotic-like serine/threonine-protein kinase
MPPALNIGQVLGRYRILEQIGAGGMGIVYRARDEQLERDVAVKVLPAGTLADEASRKQFRKEALALAKLNHPNIATIHDFENHDGLDFLITEYIPGTTIDVVLGTRRPLAEKEISHLGVQLAEGLVAAHEQAVVHRDLKPSNLRVTPDGRLKILDFGIAARLRKSELLATCTLTQEQGVTGTLPYMAPEQLCGKPSDVRTDIYSTGAVLYEMATGRRPFERELSTALAADIIHKLPTRPLQFNAKLSPRLEDIILKCLEKEPDSRYQSAKELAVDLRRLQSTSTTPVLVPTPRKRTFRRYGLAIGGVALCAAALLFITNVGGWRRGLLDRANLNPTAQSIAVLPLANLSGDPEQEYFADGMTEQLTTALGQISALRVISRTSAMHYKKTNKTMPEIARELHVDAVVEGSVERAGDQVRITAQLIEASTDRHLWARNYDRDLRGVLTLQDEVARAIAEEVRIKLTPQEQSHLAKMRPVNPKAHEAYWHGLYELHKSPQATDKAIEYFQSAVAFDPDDALAYAGLADAYYDQSSILKAPLEVMPKAKAAASRAVELDDTLAEAHASLGYVKLNFDWDWPGAEHEFRRSLELNPNLPRAHAGYGHYLLTVRHTEEAIQELDRLQKIDPLFPQSHMSLPYLLFTAERYQAAIVEAGKNGDDRVLANSLAELGRPQEAIAAADRAVRSEHNPVFLAQIASAYALAGRKDKARAMLSGIERLAEQRYVCGFSVALVFASLGENERAFDWLEKAYRDRSD